MEFKISNTDAFLWMVAKGVLANETVNYDTQTKAHVLIWAKSVSYQKGSPSEHLVWKTSVNGCFKISTAAANLAKGGISWFYYLLKSFKIF